MPERDPYMRDRNIRDAAALVEVGWPLLAAATGVAASGWFEFPWWLGVSAGFLIGALLATVTLRLYGGRSTR